MARLILEHKAQVLKDYPFGKKSLTIGRFDDNTIVLDDPAVSGYHARIDKRGVDYILTDLQSTNGTSLNNTDIVSHVLAHGDKVTIGEHALLFVGTELAKTFAEEEMLDLNKTTIRAMPERAKPLSEPLAIGKEEITTKKVERSPLFGRRVPVLVGLFILAAGLWIGLNHNPGFLKGILSPDILTGIRGNETDSLSRPLFTSQSYEKESTLTAENDPYGSLFEPLSDQDWAYVEGEKETPLIGIDEPAYMLEGIVLASASRDSFAVINGRMVRSGGTVGEARITEIGKDYVIVQHPKDDSEIKLTLRR